jgi:hypothetical protein
LHRVAEIAARFGDALVARHAVSAQQKRVLAAMVWCRTSALGGRLEWCDRCGHERPVYNSCRNRHCPSCQGSASREWVEARMERVLPVTHFHAVFTLPAELRPFFAGAGARMYDLLMRSAARTLEVLAAQKLGATLGITAVLHTWNQDLCFHPHVHCIVTGGGLTKDGVWKPSPPRWLLSVKWMRAFFRGAFLRELRVGVDTGEIALPRGWPAAGRTREARFRSLWRSTWVVHVKRPFAGVEGVYAYLGRYTHRVGISDGRVLELGHDTVTFSRRNAEPLVLPGIEFLRRFLLHTLPAGFRKIRHYGLYAASAVHAKLEAARAAIFRQGVATPRSQTEVAAAAAKGTAEMAERETESRRCPVCQVGRMRDGGTLCRVRGTRATHLPSPPRLDSS